MERQFKIGDRVRREPDGASGVVTETEFRREPNSTQPFWVRVRWDASNSKSEREENGLVAAPSNNMTAREFRGIRENVLRLTQAQLAPLLDYADPIRISEFERTTNPRPVPTHIARLMTAMCAGWRPSDWPAMLPS